MRVKTLATSLFFALGLCAIPTAYAADVTIPAVETWEQMTVPYPPNGRAATFLYPKWHKDPQGKNFEGMTMYAKAPGGSEILIGKSWNFWDPNGDGKYRTWDKVRVALKIGDGKWLVGDEGEMYTIQWKWDAHNDPVSVTARFSGSHAATPVTFFFQ